MGVKNRPVDFRQAFVHLFLERLDLFNRALEGVVKLLELGLGIVRPALGQGVKMDFGMDQVGLAGAKAGRRADPGQTPASGALLGAGRCAALRLGALRRCMASRIWVRYA